VTIEYWNEVNSLILAISLVVCFITGVVSGKL